jgi:hypothetical protein
VSQKIGQNLKAGVYKLIVLEGKEVKAGRTRRKWRKEEEKERDNEVNKCAG